MSRYTRESREKRLPKLDFITWLLTVKPFESIRKLIQFSGFVLICFSTVLTTMLFGLTTRVIHVTPVLPSDPTEITVGYPLLSWFMIVVVVYCTVDYYLEYRKLK